MAASADTSGVGKLLVVGAIVGWLFFSWWSARALERAPGVLAPRPPVQQGIANASPVAVSDYQVTSLASFQLEARVLATTSYRWDREADLAPIDIAFGWGRMSDSAVLDRLSISQSGRFYHYRWGSEGPPIDPSEIVKSSANMHLIPANDSVEDRMGEARPGHVVRLAGHLVEAVSDDGWRWKSSLTRGDAGAGACELILVDSFEIVN